MKGVLVIIDGMGDLPHKLLDNRTPLEAAETPYLDFFSARGDLGYMYPIKERFIPESDEAVVSIFDNELEYSSRGQIEAAATDIKVTRGDLALRTNFASIDNFENGNVIDRRAGRTLTSEEADVLAKAINKQIKLPVKFEFRSTVQHRGVLVLKGGFSDNISDTDSHYTKGKKIKYDKLKICQPYDDDENSQYTADIINSFTRKCFEVLNNHPINKFRRKKGLMPANVLLTRGGGIEKPDFKKYRKWAAIAYMPVEIGIAKLSGMKVFSFPYPKMKDFDVYYNLHLGLKEAIDFSKRMIRKNHKKFDYFYIHLKEPDVPGHDNKPHEKKSMIALIDKKFFGWLKSFVSKTGIDVVVTADHSTPCKLKSHSADPVPVLWYNHNKPEKKQFNERECKNGKLGKIYGKDLLKKVKFVR